MGINIIQALRALIIVMFFFSSCNVNFVNPIVNSERFTHSVSGESSAQLLDTSVEETITKNNTPTGVCVTDEINDVLDCFDVSGNPLSTLQIPGIASSDPQGLHLAGSLVSGKALPPVVYYSWEPEQALLVSEKGTATPLRETNFFLAMAGAVGQPVLAYSEVAYDNQSLHSYLFAGTFQTMGSAVPFYDSKDSLTNMALIPVAVEAVDSQARKVWYTQTAWSMGGADLVYPINRGLYIYDLETGQNIQVLGSEENFQGLSPDNSLAGSIYFDFMRDASMRVTNLATGQTVNFPLNPASDRGSGYAVFSNDGEYAAWLEAGGSMIAEPFNFQTRVRVGDIAAGAVVKEVDSTKTAQILGWERVSFIRPIGWLNTQTLVIEAHGKDRNTASLIKFDTSTGSLAFLCNGRFSGFSFPEKVN